MKNIFKGIFSAVVVLTSISPLFVTEDTTLTQLTSEVKAAEIQNLDQQEDARKKAFEAQLGFTIPQYTDNPSYVITFVDPSPNKNGIQLETDNDKYIDIKSPYTLPALSIGQHHLSFKFTDKDGALQQLEYDISILPRAPIIKTPSFDETTITLSGTGLANSEVLLFLSSSTNFYPQVVNVAADGNWEVKVRPDTGISNGIYTVAGYTRKYGYASNLSEPVVFEIGNSSVALVQNPEKTISFSFDGINKDNLQTVISQNRDLLILLAIAFALGALVTLLFKSLISDRKTNLSLKNAEQSIKRIGKNQEKTLREVFEATGNNSKDKKTAVVAKQQVQIKKEDKPEPVVQKQNENVMSKEEFLRKFKMIDPDDSKGKEKAIPKTNKDIKISLTSHQEE